MNLADADKILTEYLAANWTTTEIAWPNIEGRDFSAAGHPLLPTGTADYVALRTHGTGSRTVTVDGRCIRYSSQLFVAVCVKEGTGVRAARGHLDGLILLLENKTLSGNSGTIRMGTITGPVDYVAPNGWFVSEVGIMYFYERYNG